MVKKPEEEVPKRIVVANKTEEIKMVKKEIKQRKSSINGKPKTQHP